MEAAARTLGERTAYDPAGYSRLLFRASLLLCFAAKTARNRRSQIDTPSHSKWRLSDRKQTQAPSSDRHKIELPSARSSHPIFAPVSRRDCAKLMAVYLQERPFLA